MTDCIFCKIVNKEIQSQIILETDFNIVIKDINPKQETHLLIIPKKHYKDLNYYNPTELEAIDYFQTIQQISQKLIEPEFNLVVNTGKLAGQEVFHLHTHFMSKFKIKS